MARDYCQIKVSIWHDDEFTSLSGDAQRLYIYLCSQPKLDMAGVTPWRPRLVARSASDWTTDTVEAALCELEAAHYVLVDEETDELLVRSFIRNDELLKSPNLTKAMVKAWRSLDSQTLRGVIGFEVARLRDEDGSLRGLEHCAELFAQPLIDPRNNPFGKGSAKGSAKGCRTPAPTPTPTPAPAHALDGSASSESDGGAGFDQFWSHYPRKVGKKAARAKYAAACKRANAETIISGALRLANDPNLPEERFIPHPTTWLERDGWDDGPLPERVTNRSAERARTGWQAMSGNSAPRNPWAVQDTERLPELEEGEAS